MQNAICFQRGAGSSKIQVWALKYQHLYLDFPHRDTSLKADSILQRPECASLKTDTPVCAFVHGVVARSRVLQIISMSIYVYILNK